jgi:microcystin-dependent protein
MSALTTTMFQAPTPVLQFFSAAGTPLVGGQLFVYEAGTVTPQAAFTDSTGDTPLPNPIILNARGEVAPSATGTSCGLWLDPTLAYKLVLSPPGDTNPPTSPIWTIDNIVSPQSAILASLAAYEATIGGVPIGAQMAYAGASAPAGWLLCFGQAVSRTAFALLFATIGTAYGEGDGSTTFNVPDKRGRASIGADNMGGSPANRVTQAVSGILATTVGAVGGSQNAQQDTLTADVTSNVVILDNGHKHFQFFTSDFPGHGTPEGGVANAVGPGAQSPDMQTATAFTGIAASVTSTATVASQLTGESQNMPPVEVDNWIIFSGVVSS